MGTVEAAERQKVALRLLRALRRTTNYPASPFWWADTDAQQGRQGRAQNWYGTLYTELFNSLTFDSNRRQARFSGSEIKRILQQVNSNFPEENDTPTTNEGVCWSAEIIGRTIADFYRTWLIAIDEPSQTIRVFDIWNRWNTGNPPFGLFPLFPKLPQHISLTTPPANSYFVFQLLSGRDRVTGEPIQDVFTYTLI